MKRKMSRLLLALGVAAFSAEGLVGAMERPGEQGGIDQEARLVTPAQSLSRAGTGVGLMAIFSRGENKTEILLDQGSRFLKAGLQRRVRIANAYALGTFHESYHRLRAPHGSQRTVRSIFKLEFYQDLLQGVATLDRTLLELAGRQHIPFRLGAAEQQEMRVAVNTALRPLLSAYNTDGTGRDVFDSAKKLADARAQVYRQIFLYLSENSSNSQIKRFMEQHFEAPTSRGSFVPKPEVRQEFLALWAKNFQEQRGFAPAFVVEPHEWQGVLSAYHRTASLHRQELLGTSSAVVGEGVESSLRMLLRWDPRQLPHAEGSRRMLEQLAALPFLPAPGLRFREELIAVARAELATYNAGNSFEPNRFLAQVQSAVERLQASSDLFPVLPASAATTSGPAPPQARTGRHLSDLFRAGAPVDGLRKRLNTRTLDGLLGEQLLQRLHRATVALEGTLEAMGVSPVPIQLNHLQRLTDLLYEGYARYANLPMGETELLTQLHHMEAAYWHEIAHSYPREALEGQFAEAFVPTAAARETFVREFSQRVRAHLVPNLKPSEVQVLQRALPALETKDLIVEVVHLLLAHSADYPLGGLPALAEQRLQLQERELYAMWYGRAGMGEDLLRRMLAIYEAHPTAPEVGRFLPLLYRLQALGFGLEPAAFPPDRGGREGSGSAQQEAAPSFGGSAERRGQEATHEVEAAGREPLSRHPAAPREGRG